jgi:ketosteroid isomerase-like protein
MKRGIFVRVFLACLMVLVVHGGDARAEIQLPKPERTNAEAATLKEFEAFYAEIEAALAAEDIDRLMSYYAEDYLHHGITKKQLRFMWLEILSEFSELYSVHIFAKIDVHGSDAILVCTGALLGIPPEGGDYQAVDRWVNQNHWLTKVGGRWRMIGGATHEAPGKRGSRTLELHPLF